MSARTMRIGERATRTLTGAHVQLGFALLVGVLMAAHQGGLLKFVYLAGAVGVGWRLQRSDPAAYVGFVLWLWFLSPFVRRVSDFYGGWQDPSLILLTPYLVIGMSAATVFDRVIRRRGDPRQRPVGLGMFGFAALGTAVGIPLGFVLLPYTALLETLNYFMPLFLGAYVATQPDHVRAIERQVVATFGQASLIVGVYGIYQFTTAPAWDVAWMMNSEMGSIGKPEPYAMRVFSTMHGPGVLGTFLALALVLWIARPRAWGIPAASAAGITLLLSQVRSGWVACLVGAMFVVASLKPAQKIRAVLLIGVAVVSIGTFLVTPEMAELLSARMSTFEQLDEDKSGLARVTGHELALDLVTRRPLGLGIGQTDERVEGYISMRDSTIVAGLLQFGLFGAPLYFTAVWLAAVQMWRYYRRGTSAEGVALACSGFGLLSISALGVVSAGPIGSCFWLIAGLAVADRHLARVRQADRRAAAANALRVRATPRDPVLA